MNRRSRIALPLAVVLTVAALAQERHIPEQPIPFSHKLHIGLALKCKDCHTNPDPGEIEGIPATSKCMACHFSIATGKPAIQKLKAYADQKQPVPWVRVYQIPSYVDFSHRTHLAAGFKCEKCHGPVESRDALSKESDISMGGCIACHKQNKAAINCTYCHENRQ